MINATKDIDGTKQWVYLTLTVDGDTCRYVSVQPWNTNTPVLTGQDLEDWCDGREDIYQVEILRSMYPNADLSETAGDTELEKFTAWIAAGHTNPDGTVIEKVPFTNSHSYTGNLNTRKLEELNTDLQTYLYTKYDVGTQISLNAIYSMETTPAPVITGLDSLFAWISGVMEYYYTKKINIRDGEDWESVTWDFSQFDATDPNISLEALMGPQ